MLFADVTGAQKREHLNEKRQQQVEEIVTRKRTRDRAVRRIGNVKGQNDRRAYDEGLESLGAPHPAQPEDGHNHIEQADNEEYRARRRTKRYRLRARHGRPVNLQIEARPRNGHPDKRQAGDGQASGVRD